MHLLRVLLPLLVLLPAAVDAQRPWRVDAKPLVQFGELDGDGPYTFSQIVGAVRLSSGRIVVADSAANEVRVFDAGGKHVETLGGAGSGPGEFQMLRRIWLLPRDSVQAFDVRTGRSTVYGPGPKFLTTVQVSPGTPAGRMADGAFISTVGVAPPEKIADFRGLIEYNGFVIRRLPPENRPDTIARGKAGQSLVVPGTPSFRQYPFPFGRSALIAVGPTRFYYGDTHSAEIGIYDATGKQLGRFKVNGSSKPIGAADIERWVEWDGTRRSTEQARVDARNAFKQIPPNPRTPEFAALKLDDAGNLWVRRYGPPWAQSQEWDVYDANGRALATIRFPGRFEPLHIGADFVLGSNKDEYDVERVEMYRLIR